MATNLRPGIDTPPPSHFLIAKLNVTHNDQKQLRAALEDLGTVIDECLDSERTHNGHKVVADLQHNILVAFGLPFFLGPLAARTDGTIPNFPPGGQFKRRFSSRFNKKVPVPLYLRAMNADRDREWIAKQASPNTPEADIDVRYQNWLAQGECDIIIYIESAVGFLNSTSWNKIEKLLCEQHGLALHAPVQESFGSEDGRDLTGWFDPKSNLDDEIEDNPARYRRRVYLPHPAPIYPGEAETNRDPLAYNGGTYLVHRKYELNLDRWNDDEFTFTSTTSGCPFKGDAARNHAIGRDRETGKVICGSSGQLLDEEKGSAEVSLALLDCHIAMARGVNPAPFRGPFTPLEEPDDINVFNIQDTRIRRRGGNWKEIDSTTGKTKYGLHFFSFQNNIQQTGFEFINNIWLMNPMFRMRIDPILDPENGIARPLEGAYYFVPPPHRNFPGEVFFREEY